ncbi:ABC transporter permease [Candidatus Bipolaricaulota bacterium]|nr:ABC transporter permease [Candidatus Bipolaricaulota bacterium]
MFAYFLRRLLLMIPVILGVILVVTATLDFIPGDPAELLLGQFATPESIQTLRHELNLDQPFFIRYLRYVGDLFRGNLGQSITLKRAVSEEIMETLPATLELTGVSMLLVLVVSIPLGTLVAAKPNSVLDNIVRLFSLAGLSMPVFWTGIVLILLFSVNLRLFPVGGYGGLRHLLLPAVTLASASIGMVTRMVRSSVMEVLREEYITSARAKGLKEWTVLFKHALRNGLIPVVTVLGSQVGQMMGGAILTESVFAWPGLGRLTVHAIFRRDFVLIQGVVVVLALIYVLVNLLVDLSYALINPRISYQ